MLSHQCLHVLFVLFLLTTNKLQVLASSFVTHCQISLSYNQFSKSSPPDKTSGAFIFLVAITIFLAAITMHKLCTPPSTSVGSNLCNNLSFLWIWQLLLNFFANSMAGFHLLWRNITTRITKNFKDFLLQNICMHFTGNAYHV